MRRIHGLLLGLCFIALSGSAVLVGTSHSLAQVGQEKRAEKNYWRHHDGRWSYWDAGDRRWYYTDGSHWFWHNGKAWQPYRFDKTFGREGFERGQYVVPAEGATIVAPTHSVYVPR
jgi:hypothetical protein